MECFQQASHHLIHLGQQDQRSVTAYKRDNSHFDALPVVAGRASMYYPFYDNPFVEISSHHALEESLAITVEPKPFKDGTQLQALSDSKVIFVPAERKTNPSAVDHCDYHQEPLIVQDTAKQPTTTQAAPKVSKCFQHQEDRWDEHYQELLRYKQKNGNCHVPQNYPQDLALARWARRQRHQYKRKCQGRKSSMSDERQSLLELAGFVWDPQMDVWEIRRQELEEYKRAHGNCNVPSRYAENPQLATWVKRQRRQYKQMHTGTQSRLPRERFEILNSMGFVWKHRESSSARANRPIRRVH